MATFWIGTSGWHYDHWRGVFYPEHLPKREWLRYYSEHFNTVEINNSFYRQPSAAAWKSWREDAPEGFRFAVKGHRFVTHMRKLKAPEDSLKRVIDGARRLGDHLGPVLYQLPADFPLNEERLERFRHFAGLLRHGPESVVEFRDETWLVDDVFAVMQRYGIGFCIADAPESECPLKVTSGIVYVRFHGSEARYQGRYTDGQLREWAERIRRLARGRRDVYCYFNNDMRGYAVENARTLREALGVVVPRGAVAATASR